MAAHLGACTVISHVEIGSNPKPAEIAGLTTRAGDSFAFEPVGATISGGKLYAVTATGQLVVPADSIANVWVKHFSTSRTVGLVAGLTVILVGFVALANKTAGSSTCVSCP